MSKTVYQYVNLVGKNLESGIDALKQTKVDYPVLTVEGETVVNVKYPYGDIRRYGAVGDGITDDSTALQNALNCNKDVFIPTGTFYVNSQVTVESKTGVTLRGESNKDSIILIGTAIPLWHAPIHWVSCTSCTVRDFTIDGNKENVYEQEYNGVIKPFDDINHIRFMFVVNCTDFKAINTRFINSYGTGYTLQGLERGEFRNCYFHDIDCGIFDAKAISRDILIDHCYFDGGVKSEPIAFEHGERIRIRDCYFTNKTSASGVFLGLVYDAVVENCTFNGTSIGIKVTQYESHFDLGDSEVVQKPTNIRILNNTFESNNNVAVSIKGAGLVISQGNSYNYSGVFVMNVDTFKSVEDIFRIATGFYNYGIQPKADSNDTNAVTDILLIYNPTVLYDNTASTMKFFQPSSASVFTSAILRGHYKNGGVLYDTNADFASKVTVVD